MKIFQALCGAWMLASTLYPCHTQAALRAPSNLAVQSVSSTQLNLSWTDHAQNGLGFQLQFATTPFTSPTSIPIPSFPPGVSPSYAHIGRNAITTYWYRIRANGPGGSTSPWPNTAFATTAPDGVHGIAAPRSGAIDVSWTPNPANRNIAGYTVRYGIAPNFSDAVARWVAGNNRSMYSATGLMPGQIYYISVKAVGNEHAYSSAFSAAVNTTSSAGLRGTSISPLFFGQNAWMPKQIGTEVTNGDLEALLCGRRYATNGGVCVPKEVQASGVYFCREK